MKIYAINSIHTNTINKKEPCKYSTIENIKLSPNNDKTTFKGVKVSAFRKEWSSDTIKEIRNSLKIDTNTWKENLKQRLLKEAKIPEGMSGSYEESYFRIIEDIASLGINELVIAYNRNEAKKDALKLLEEKIALRRDIITWKSQEDIENSLIRQKKDTTQIAFLKSVQKVFDEQIDSQLIIPAQRIREYKETDMPNCMMLSSKNKDLNLCFIDMIQQKFNGNFVKINNVNNLFKELEAAEKNYKDKHEWNVLYIDNFEKTINTSQAESWQIETMKALMTSVAEKYHTTILFSTEHEEKLDKIALQPHRVTKIDTSEIVYYKDSILDYIKTKLSQSDCYDKTPIFTINCLLELADKNNILEWEYSEQNLNYINESLEKSLKKDDYKNILKKAYENLRDLGNK